MLDLSGVAVVLAELLVLFLPGFGVAVGAGLARWPAVAAAPLIGYGLTTVGGPLTASLGVAWNIATFLVLSLVAGAVLFALRIFSAGRRGERSNEADPTVPVVGRTRLADVAMLAGVLIGFAITAVTVLRGIGSLNAIHQDWDAVFHANAIRFIMDSGNADPSALGPVIDYEAAGFYYPNGFHALTAAIGGVSGGNVPALLNGQILLVGGIAGLGLAVLLRAFGLRLAAIVSAPILLAAFASFPYDTLFRGPVLPFAVGVALLPAYAVVVENALSTRRAPILILSALATCGLIGLQPSTAVTGIVFAIALVAFRWISTPSRIRQDVVIGVSIGGLTAVLAVQSLLQATGATVIDVQDWAAVETAGQAVGDMLLLNHAASFPQYWLVALVAIGALGFRRLRAMWWWLAGSAVFFVLFVASAAYDAPLVEKLTGLWWNDRWRFAAIVVLGMAVLATNGVVVAADTLAGLGRRIPALRALTSRQLVAGTAALVLALFALLSSGFYVDHNADRMASAYQDGPTVTDAERAAMAVLAGMVAPGERVMNDPNDGSPWMYALQDVTPVFGHILNPPTLPGRPIGPQDLLLRFNCLDSDPDVRQIVEDNNIAYVYLGDGFIRAEFEHFAGLDDLSGVDSLQEVWSNEDEDLVIYEVHLAPLAEPSRACSADSSN